MFFFRSDGMTLAEILVSAAILSAIFIPLVRFITTMTKGLVTVEARGKGADVLLRSVVDIERDFKDMIEVRSCSEVKIDFYMDSHRAPSYNGNADPDADGIPNRVDVDDDGDGFDHLRTAADFFNLPSAIRTSGRKQGLDVDDDDDDNNGVRDVRCQYEFDAGKGILTRRFRYGYTGSPSGWSQKETVISSLVDFKFNPTGSPTAVDPITQSPPSITDANFDGVFDVVELSEGGGGGGFPLDNIDETRYITLIGYSMTIQPNPKRPETYTLSSVIKPALLAVKAKYP